MGNTTETTLKATTMVVIPTSTESIAVDKRDWKRLKSTVESCNFHTNYWEDLASLFFGGTLSGLFAWLSVSNNEANIKSRMMIICAVIICFLLSIVCYIASRGYTKQKKATIESIKNELKFIEDKVS